MTYKVAVYHLSVPNKKNLEKTQMLEYFAQGVRQAGDHVFDVHTHLIQPAHVAVIQGWIAQTPDRPHLKLRKQVIDNQIQRGHKVLTADSNLFLYANTANPLHYLRYSFNGVFANTGIYCDATVDPGRWQTIRQDLNLAVKDYRSRGDHILICLQRNGGWSMGSESVVDWTHRVIHQIRQYTDRPILLRPHPGDKKSHTYLQPLQAHLPAWRATVSANTSLLHDLQGCWAVVNHNSSPAVAAAIEGYPVFVTDLARSQCGEIANTDLAQIESPVLPVRDQWLERLAMSHWKFDELKSGQAWAHLRQYVGGIP